LFIICNSLQIFNYNPNKLLIWGLRRTNMLVLFIFLQRSDGDLMDCVLSHKQPAFDHPLLKGQKPLVNFVNWNKENSAIFFMLFKLLYFNFKLIIFHTYLIKYRILRKDQKAITKRKFWVITFNYGAYLMNRVQKEQFQ
jgi:uncharacterized membrane protein